MKTTKELVKFNIETAIITALDTEYKEVQKITDAKSKAIVAEGRRKYRELRLAVVDGHKEEKREALDHCNFLDAEKRRILALLAPGESHLDDIWKADKEEKEAKERERIQLIQDKINDIRSLGMMVINLDSPTIEDRLRLLMSTEISEKIYQELKPQALEAQNTAVADLEKALADRLQFEKEEEDRKKEAERLEIVREEQIQHQAKIDAANKKLDEKKQRLEREEFERQAKIKAEEEAKEKAMIANLERIEREEAQATEKARQEALKPDKEKLIRFADELIDIVYPQIKSAKAQKIISGAGKKLVEIGINIKEQANKL